MHLPQRRLKCRTASSASFTPALLAEIPFSPDHVFCVAETAGIISGKDVTAVLSLSDPAVFWHHSHCSAPHVR